MSASSNPSPLATVAMACALALTSLPAGLSAQPAAATTAGSPQPASRTPRGTVTLNFVNAEIEGVTRAIGAMLGRQFIVDPRVRGTITVTSEQPQTVRDAYQSYLTALRGLGFAVVESGGLMRVVPEQEAKLQTGTVVIGENAVRADVIITQIFQLQHENANNLVAVLRPLITANNTINASPATNTLVITDYAENLQRIGRMIAALDQPAGSDVEIIPLQHAVASDIVALVQRLADGAPAIVVPGAVGAGGGTTILADARSNSLIVRAANASRLASIRGIVGKLDRPSSSVGPGGGMWVVHLKNADAVRLATVVRAAFAAIGTGTGGSGGASGPTGAPVAPTPFSQQQPALGGAAPSAAATAPITAAAQPQTGGFIQADPATNSLIITAPEPLYRQVRAMIDQLDTRRAQVYIEVLIVEVQGENAADFGFQWQGIVGNRGDKNVVGLGTNFGTTGNIIQLQTGAASGTVSLGEGFNIGLIRNYGGTYALSAIARLLQSQTATNIVNTPNLVTVDNEEGKIVVGSNVPFITGQFTQTGTQPSNPFQTIERKDVGTTLRIKPQIGENGTIRMQIFQESSALIDRVAPGTTNAGPSTTKRVIETNVIVDDGGIIALGGLIEDRFVDNNSKVPLLGDIPGVGALFRSQNRTKTRTNLMVFLRPTVMRDTANSERVTLDRYDIIRSQQRDSQPAPSTVLPNDAPVLPPLRTPPAPAAETRKAP